MLKEFFKELNSALPMKRQLFLLLRNLPLPERVYRHFYFSGPFSVTVDDSRSFNFFHFETSYENGLFWRGLASYEPSSLELWIKLAATSSVIVDGGANSGLYSLVAGAVNPRGRIFAFEPVSHIFARLVENVSINSFDVVAEELALSDSSGTAAFYLTPGEFAVNSSLDKLSSTVPGATEIRVKTVRLDEYLAEHGVEGIDLLKLDVEGHEPQALQGLGALLSKNRPKILIEINRPQTGEEIAKIFQGLNYRYFIIDEGVGLTEVAQPIPAETIWGQNYYLCPAEEADSYSAPSSRH